MHKEQRYAMRLTGLVAALALVGLSGTAPAATNVWDVNVTPDNGFGGLIGGWTNASAGTIFAAWNAFDGYPTDSTPDAGTFGPTPQSVVEHTSGAFLTGGNIYSFAVPTDFTVTLTGYGTTPGTRTLALRTETVGTELDYGSVLLNGVGATRVETFRAAFTGGQGGFEVESLWIWENVANAGAYLFDFNAAGSSMSLSQVATYASALGASPVPEPGTWMLLASGLAVVGVLRARRASA